jgi:hypothetical protein
MAGLGWPNREAMQLYPTPHEVQTQHENFFQHDEARMLIKCYVMVKPCNLSGRRSATCPTAPALLFSPTIPSQDA